VNLHRRSHQLSFCPRDSWQGQFPPHRCRKHMWQILTTEQYALNKLSNYLQLYSGVVYQLVVRHRYWKHIANFEHGLHYVLTISKLNNHRTDMALKGTWERSLGCIKAYNLRIRNLISYSTFIGQHLWLSLPSFRKLCGKN
jgi:hypothetical protein